MAKANPDIANAGPRILKAVGRAEARANAPALDFGPGTFGIAQRAKEDAPGITMRFLETGKVGE